MKYIKNRYIFHTTEKYITSQKPYFFAMRLVQDGANSNLINCLPTSPTLVAAHEGCYRTAPETLRLSPEREQSRQSGR